MSGATVAIVASRRAECGHLQVHDPSENTRISAQAVGLRVAHGGAVQTPEDKEAALQPVTVRPFLALARRLPSARPPEDLFKRPRCYPAGRGLPLRRCLRAGWKKRRLTGG